MSSPLEGAQAGQSDRMLASRGSSAQRLASYHRIRHRLSKRKNLCTVQMFSSINTAPRPAGSEYHSGRRDVVLRPSRVAAGLGHYLNA